MAIPVEAAQVARHEPTLLIRHTRGHRGASYADLSILPNLDLEAVDRRADRAGLLRHEIRGRGRHLRARLSQAVGQGDWISCARAIGTNPPPAGAPPTRRHRSVEGTASPPLTSRSCLSMVGTSEACVRPSRPISSPNTSAENRPRTSSVHPTWAARCTSASPPTWPRDREAYQRSRSVRPKRATDALALASRAEERIGTALALGSPDVPESRGSATGLGSGSGVGARHVCRVHDGTPTLLARWPGQIVERRDPVRIERRFERRIVHVLLGAEDQVGPITSSARSMEAAPNLGLSGARTAPVRGTARGPGWITCWGGPRAPRSSPAQPREAPGGGPCDLPQRRARRRSKHHHRRPRRERRGGSGPPP